VLKAAREWAMMPVSALPATGLTNHRVDDFPTLAASAFSSHFFIKALRGSFCRAIENALYESSNLSNLKKTLPNVTK
jgi:hypothetical protein